MGLKDRLKGLMGFVRRTERSVPQHGHQPASHVVILDGTMSTLDEGEETNVGLIYKMLTEVAHDHDIGVMYEAGVQWTDWSATMNVIEGRGINRQIRRAYGWLAARYRPGDRIYLIGYSRGAYAVRSLAGAIDLIGLLKPEVATERMVREAYRYYEFGRDAAVCAEFRDRYCHAETPIEAVAVFDTVKSLGFRAPFYWRWEEVKHAFHNHELSPLVRHGFHALALDETREAFAPVLWSCPPDYPGDVEQVWFRGAHGDIGGQLMGFKPARKLANIPLLWMCERLESCGLPLPEGYAARFPTDPDAPEIGTWKGWGKVFLARKRRVVGQDPSESIHPTALGRKTPARILIGATPEGAGA